MSDYLAELNYEDFTNFFNEKNKIMKGLVELKDKHHYFKVKRGDFGVVISLDFINAIIKLKPLPDDMPQDLKDKIIELFRQLPPAINDSGL